MKNFSRCRFIQNTLAGAPGIALLPLLRKVLVALMILLNKIALVL